MVKRGLYTAYKTVQFCYPLPFNTLVAQMEAQLPTKEKVIGSSPIKSARLLFWGDMFQGGEFALQADCEGFDSLSFHQIK
jgi:hypothetical protein